MILGSFCTTALFSQEGKYNSLMWEISGPGMKKPSYLYGTMHVSNKVAFHLSDSFFLALSSVDMIALESNPEVWLKEFTTSDQFKNYAGLFGGGLWSGQYGFYENTFQLQKPTADEYKALLRNEPGLVNGLLYRNSYGGENFEEDTYLDLFIYQAGKKLGKLIASLEDFKQSMEMAEKARMPDKKSKEKLEERKKKMELLESGVNLFEKMEDAYRTGNLDLLDSISRLMNTSDNYQKYLIDERNIIMAVTMDSLMRLRSVFSGIGAAHLPGKDGVIELLRKKGYKVRPVVFSAPKDSKLKAKIEKRKVPLVYTLQFAEDSAFSVQIPGELILTDKSGLTRQYLYSDMGNGCYYYVMRMQTMSAWTGQTQHEIFMKLDSMLFENIPGKIISKKTFTFTDGYSGIEIINKTKGGDYQRYSIYILPTEVFVFKVAGKGEYTKAPEISTFFNSVRFGTQDATHKLFISDASGFSIMMPPVADLSAPGSESEKYIASDLLKGHFYIAMHASYHDLDFIEQDSFELNYIKEQFLEKTKFSLVSSGPVEKPGLTGCRFRAKSDDRFLSGQIVIKGPDYYLLAVISNDSSHHEPFFTSFLVREQVTTSPFTEQSDSSMLFRVNTSVKMDAISYSIFGDLFDQRTDDLVPDEYEFDQKIKEELYQDPITGEKVRVKYKKLHKYFYEDTIASFFSDELRYIISGKDLIVKSKVFSKKDRRDILDVLLGESASSRAIKIRMILDAGAFWTIYACADSLGGLNAFSKKFFETFSVFDTVIGTSIQTDKAELLLTHLTGSDSANRLHAGNAIYYTSYYFSDKHFAKLCTFLASKAFLELDVRKRAELITAFGRMKKSNCIPVLEKLYANAGDTAAIQFAVLQALTMLSTKQGNATFLRSILKDTPLTSEYQEYSIDQVFSALYDNAELSTSLYPGLFKLLRFREYEYHVYTLLSYLVREKKVTTEQVNSEKDMILRLANDEIKRQSTVLSEEEQGYKNFTLTSLSSEREDEVSLSYGNNTLFKFANILTLYMDDAPVKSFFGKLKKLKDEDLRIALACRYIKLGFPVHDSVWQQIALQPGLRTPLVCWLQEIKQEKLFPKQFKTYEMLSEGCMHELFKPEAGDSIRLDTVMHVRGKKGASRLYVYKYKAKEAKIWTWCSIVFGKEDKSGFPETDFFQTQNGSQEIEQDRKEVITSLLKSIRMEGRARATPDDANSFFPGLFSNPDN